MRALVSRFRSSQTFAAHSHANFGFGALVCAIVAAIGLAAHPAFAQADRTAAAFWKTVQAACDATAAKPPSELGRRIAQTAIDEFTRFGGHQVDSNGRLFRFGLTEAEHTEDDGGGRGRASAISAGGR